MYYPYIIAMCYCVTEIVRGARVIPLVPCKKYCIFDRNKLCNESRRPGYTENVMLRTSERLSVVAHDIIIIF